MNNVIPLPTRTLSLTLDLSDPEVVHEIERRAEGAERTAFATQALRLGILAVRQASGSLDAEVIQREGEHLLSAVAAVLQDRTSELSNGLTRTMVQYLDPSSGALSQRLERLLAPNGGELETMLARHLHGDHSVLAQTLAKHLGEQSALFKMLSPQQSDGLLATLTTSLRRALDGQRDEVLKQFSLDQKGSALSRLVSEVTASNGKLRDDLASDVAKVVSEFSLDNEDGALRRLVAQVERAQATITEELSLDCEGSALQRLSTMLSKTSKSVETSLTLDNEASPLARLKRELLQVLAQQEETSSKFQAEVRTTLETFKTRREVSAKSTLHGHTFEDQAGELLTLEAQRIGDLCETVATTRGRLQRNVGDYVIELGSESAAPGARIACEVKSNKRYTMKAALAELDDARENRDAQVGLFIFDRASAPRHMDPIYRVEGSVLVVWDAADQTTDVYLRVALGLARSIALQERLTASTGAADFAAVDELVVGIAAHVTSLNEIDKAARGVKKNGEAILAAATVMRDALERQVEELREHLASVRAAGVRNDAP